MKEDGGAAGATTPRGEAAARWFGGRFKAETLLGRGQGIETWRGVDRAGDAVVVRTIRASRVPASVRAWLEVEAGVLSDVDGVASPVVTGIEGSTLFIARPFVRGCTLAEKLADGPLTPSETLAMALPLLDALERVHARGIVHGNIKPSNVVLAGGSPSSPVVVDFGLARHEFLGEELETVPPARVAYLSPEQSGLLERGVDERADWYALGLLKYEALTLRPAFQGRGVSEVLRHHLTSSPAQLERHAPGAPRALGRIIARLLRKDPRDRYQTARGIRADVEELAAALAAGRREPDLVVGGRDVRASITEPAFTGRADELAALERALADAEAGRGGLVLAAGESGAGKTWLLEKLARGAVERGAWVLRGHGVAGVARRPFQVLSEISREIASGARDAPGRAERLAAGAGSMGDAIAESLPPMQPVLGGANRAAAGVAPSEEHNLAALATMLDALGAESEPAVIILDDAQWCDELTLRLLARWHAEAGEDRRHVLVVAAFRPEDAGRRHPLWALDGAPRVELARFDDEDVREQVASMAGELPDRAAQIIIDHADGNPFVVTALLFGLVESGTLTHAAGEWTLDEDALAALRIARGPADMLAARIARVSEPARKLLAVGALLGRSFDPAFAGELAGMEPAAAVRAVQEVRGRLLWVDAAGTSATLFHDRIRDAVRSELADDDRRALHRRAARLIEESGTHQPFELAYHHDAAGHPESALPYALEAAETARAQHDTELAERYYRTALRGVRWDTAAEVQYRIARGLGDVLVVRSQYEEAARELDEAYALAPDSAARAEVEERRAQLALKTGDLQAASRRGEHALELLGRYVPRSALVCTLVVLWELLVQVLHTWVPSRLVGRRALEGAGFEDDMAAVRIFNSLNGPYFFARAGVWLLWAHLRALNLSERYPPTAARGREYGVHGSACAGFPRLFDRAVRYTRAGAEMCAERGDLWGEARALQFLALSLCATGRYRASIEASERGGRLFERVGDAWEASGALNWAAVCRYWTGDLAGAARAGERLVERARAIDDAHGVAFGMDAWVRAAEGRVPTDILHEELRRRKDDVQASVLLGQAEALRLLSEDRPADAEALVDQVLRRLREERSFIHESNVSLFAYRLTAQRRQAQAVPATAPRERARVLARASRASRRALGLARKYCNIRPHALREAAVIAAMRGRAERARALVDQSVEAAESLGARFQAALGREIRGELGIALGWEGAAEELEQAKTELAAMRAPLAEAPAAVTISLIDRFSAILQAGHRIARSLAEDAVLSALRDEALELLRAQRCSIVTAEPGHGADPRVVSGDAGPVSADLVRHALRDGIPVVRPHPAHTIEHDDTLQRAAVRSAVCAPIRARGRISGYLYATHADVSAAFGEQERRIVEFLTTLAGAALENAEGFQRIEAFSRELEERVEERTAELARANADLEVSLRKLEDTQGQLIHAGRMAAVGTLVAGLSHELNNPLTVIAGNVDNLLKLMPEDERSRRMLEAIHRHARRAGKLVRALLGFSRTRPITREEIAAGDLAASVAELLAAEAHQREVELAVSVADDVPALWLSHQEIESALVNIVTNALEATPGGGSVELTVTRERRDGRDGVVFAVCDTGAGMPPEIESQVFDPFFTTKPVGQGTGLGLSLARQAVTAHDGDLDVDSRRGRGTTMRLWLPAVSRSRSAG